MRTIAETLALALAALLDALFGVGRFLRDVLAPPPSAAAAYDEATALLQSAHADIESAVEMPEPVASIARRILSGDDTAPVYMLRPREQAWVGAARRYGLDVTGMDDDLLDAYVTGRWRAMRLAPAFPDETLQRVEGVLAVEPEVYARDLSFT